MAYVNVAEWSPRHVAEWLRGLDDTVQPYVQFFLNNSINGCHLLTLASNDLVHLNVVKIGHQEIILEAVDLLRQLHYNLTSENLQSLCLKLGCKARSLCNALKQQYLSHENSKNLITTETLSSVSDILALVKILISWLDRYPFEGQDEYQVVRKTVLQHSIELASTSQRDQFAEKPHEIIQKNCHNIAEQCDTIVQKFNDSLIIQPASLSVATVKKSSDEDLGIHIHSSYSGVHIIGAVKFQSPAYYCGKICEGDEIIQVNYQTVVGWQLKNLVCATSEHPSEIHLTIKKRPHHSNALEEVITMWPFRIPSKRTAFRKMNKWSKAKSTHFPLPEIYSPLSSSTKDMNGSQHNGSNILLPLDGIKHPVSQPLNSDFASKRRPRVNRRVTIDSVPPLRIHSPANVAELKSAFKIVEPTNVREKYATYNTNRISDSSKPANSRILYPGPCKLSSTECDKWKTENDKNCNVTNNSERNSEVKCILSDVHQDQFSMLSCSQNGYDNENGTDDTAVKNKIESLSKIQHSSVSPKFSNNCISSNLVMQKDNTSTKMTKDHGKVAGLVSEEKVYNVEKDTINCQENSIECKSDNSKHSAESIQDLVNNPKFDGKSDITRFQVVSFPSPGVNTRTFIRQDTRNKKPIQNITDEVNKIENHDEQTSSLTTQSDTDVSEGQSDTSLEDITDNGNGKYAKHESSMTLCQSNMISTYYSIPENYKNSSNNAREEMVYYRKQKSKVPRLQRRFTTDQPLLPRELQSEYCSAFRPVTGRSVSCIDVSQIVENISNDNVINTKYLASMNFPSAANENMPTNLYKSFNEQNSEHWSLSNSKTPNHIVSLDQKPVVANSLDTNGVGMLHDRIQKPSKNSMYKQKKDSVSAGYVAKIAESFNSITRQQGTSLNTYRNEALLHSTTGQLYPPISSYASIMKPKPLRGNQLLAFMQDKHTVNIDDRYVSNIPSQESNCLHPAKITTCIENNVKDSRKECLDFKQTNKLLRTATSEEIQNMYTTYGNSGRVFENMHTNGDALWTASLKIEEKTNTTGHNISQKLISAETEDRYKYLEFQTTNLRKTTSIKKPQEQHTEQLAQKLKTLIFGEKEKNIFSEKHSFVAQPTDNASTSRSKVSAAVQTDTLEDNISCFEDSYLNTAFASKESGHGNGKIFKPCQNLSDDSIVYSSNSSLTSSTSSGSHYYYVETQIRPELTISVPLLNQVSPEINDSNRTSHLPRMGVAAMLGKKRTIPYGSSDSGSETNTRQEHTKDYSPTHTSFLGHSTVPINV